MGLRSTFTLLIETFMWSKTFHVQCPSRLVKEQRNMNTKKLQWFYRIYRVFIPWMFFAPFCENSRHLSPLTPDMSVKFCVRFYSLIPSVDLWPINIIEVIEFWTWVEFWLRRYFSSPVAEISVCRFEGDRGQNNDPLISLKQFVKLIAGSY